MNNTAVLYNYSHIFVDASPMLILKECTSDIFGLVRLSSPRSRFVIYKNNLKGYPKEMEWNGLAQF
jgi:hypothetical protein